MKKSNPTIDVALAQIGGAPLTWVGEMARITAINAKKSKK